MPGLTRDLLLAALLLLTVLLMSVFHFFLLKEKSGAKKFKAAHNSKVKCLVNQTFIALFYFRGAVWGTHYFITFPFVSSTS
jgi:hypothetical protein